tara:strand:- start:4926 stop:7778 length:2853 start_codon:yes stop_codon:yes gene_type:complete
MAKSKRPQGNLDIPEPQIQTGISAADTFVDPGVAGMPAPPPGEAPPVQPDNQKAKDLLALSESLGNLSTSLRQWGSATSRGEGIIQDFGEEQAILKRQMDSMGESFTSAVSEGTLEALEHPAAQRGICKGLGKLTARDYAVMMEAKKEELRNSPEAVDINSMMSLWDQGAMGMAMPKTSRPDVFEREYIKALSPYRSKFEAEHREWLGAKAMSDAEESLKFDIGNVLDASSLMQSEPKVSYNASGTPIFTPMTDEEIYDLNVTGGAKKVTELLDEEFGSILGAARSKEVVGEHLLNLAMNADNPLTSKMAIDILKNTQVGPPNNRTSLFETPSIKNQYDLVKDRIAAKQAINTNKIQTRNFKSFVQTNIKNQTTDSLVDFFSTQKGTVTDEAAFQSIMAQLDGQREQFIDPNTTVSREGDKLVYQTILEDGTIVSETVNMREVVSNARNIYWDKSKAEHAKYMYTIPDGADSSPADELRKKGYDEGMIEAVIDVKTSIETNMPSSVLQSEADNTYKLVGQLRANLGTDFYKDNESAGMAAFRKGLAAAVAIKETGSHWLFNETFQSHESRRFWKTAEMLMTHPALAAYGGGTPEKVYQRMVGLSDTRPISLEEFNKVWEDKGLPALQNKMTGGLFSKGIKLADPLRASQEIEDIASTLYAIGAVNDIEKAITYAMDDYIDNTIDVGGQHVPKSEIPMEIYNELPEDLQFNVSLNNDFWELLDSFDVVDQFTAADLVKGGAATATQVLEIVDNWWYETVQDEDRSQQKLRILKEVIKQSKEMGKPTRKAGLNDALDLARERFKKAPPKDWLIENPQNIKDITFSHVRGSNGQHYFIEVETTDGMVFDTGNPNNFQRPYTLHELVNIGIEGKKGVNVGLPVGADKDDYVNISQWLQFMPTPERMSRSERPHYMTKDEFMQYTGPGSGSRSWEEKRIDIMRERDPDIAGPTYD